MKPNGSGDSDPLEHLGYGGPIDLNHRVECFVSTDYRKIGFGYTAVPLAERLAVLDLVLRYFDKYWHNLKFLKS